MNIEYLMEFGVFAEHLNFTKAASSLYMTQPTLSKHMAALERELGCELIRREGDAVSLTSAGSAILEDVIRVKHDYEKLLSHIADLKSATPMSIRIMMFDAYRPMQDIVSTACRNLRAVNQMFEVNRIQVERHSPIEDVRQGRADVCYTAISPGTQTAGLSIKTLYDEPLLAVVSNRHPLAKRSAISVRDLDGELWRYPASDAFADSYGLIRSLLNAHGVSMRGLPEPWMRTSDFFNFSFDEGVFLGSASGVLRDSPMTSLSSYSVLRLEEADMLTPCNLIWAKDNANPAIPVFVEEIRRVVASVDIPRYWQA